MLNQRKTIKNSYLNDGGFLFILFHMKQLWYRIQFWIEHHLSPRHLKVVKTAFDGPAYDWGYLLRLEQSKLKEMKNYFESKFSRETFDHENDIKWIGICIDLIDIIVNQPDEHPYVNINNMWRFIRSTDYVNGVIKEDVEDYYKSYPQDLRWVKAEHLYYEIRKRYTSHWWD